MAPRLRSKRNAAHSDVDAEGEVESSSQLNRSRPTSPSVQQLSIAPHLQDIDIDALMEILPEVSLQSPSPEMVAMCYRTLIDYHEAALKSQEEHDQLASDLERTTLERDQALQDKESSSSKLEAIVEATQAELHQVKQEKIELSELYLTP